MTRTYAEFLKKDDCLLLLVDIQKVMLDPCPEGDVVHKHSVALLEIARILEIPVLFTVHNAEKLGGVLPRLTEQLGSPKVFNKIEFSCFENEAIARALEGFARRTLLMAGLETHICIFQTAAHALRLGYRVHVAADAVASRKSLDWEVGLKRLEKAGALVSSTEMMIFELLSRAGTPEFRAALPFLKAL
jgi:nicotinamidase-related amidase